MCGIYGEFFNKKRLTDKVSFIKENDKNYHRGPDMQGYWSNDLNCQMGFRRLSILDLSLLGNQPMTSENDEFIVVFNGEIYNYKVLKQVLENVGFIFRSSSDTEVLVNYIQHFGIDKTVEDLDGMFAFAVYSKVENAMYLIRDFAGIKPLFYSYSNNQLVFGSQYNQITKHPLNKKSAINTEIVYLYMKLHYMPAPHGIIENTYQVEPGQIVKIDSEGKLTSKYYWEFPELKKEALITDKIAAINLLSEALNDAVKDELVADVSVGSFLSGGIDSPLITYFSNLHRPNIKAFSIGSDDPIYDESDDATTYSKLIGCDFKLQKMKGEIALKALRESMPHLYEPFGDSSLIPTFQLCQNAKSHCTVMLSGDGGDELFFGYERFGSLIKNKKWLWIPKPFRYTFYLIDKILFKNRHVNEHFLQPNLSKAHQFLNSVVNDHDLKTLFPNYKHSKRKQLHIYDYKDSQEELDLLHSMRKAEFYGMMQKTLAKVDRMSMANSVEVRVPFLKKSFIVASLKIHPQLSLGAGKKKEILKNMLKTIFPSAPISDLKRGFSIPLDDWLRNDLKKDIEAAIFNRGFLEAFSISKQALTSIWEKHQSGINGNKRLLFSLYSLAIWYQEQNV